MKNLNKLYERYLKLIGIEAVPDGVKGLTEIVRNHLCYIPFENVSKLLLFDKEKTGRSITLSEYLDNIEFLSLGGTCYSNNPFLHELLSFLGYRNYLLGADMGEPNGHTCVRAILDSNQYHIDVGYAAPFREPIPLDNLPYEIKHGEYTYLFNKIENMDKYGLLVFLDGEIVHGYLVNEDPRNFGFFSKTIRESFKTENKFISSIRITRFFEDKTVELKNRTLITYNGNKSHSRELLDIGDMAFAVKTELKMPNCPIKEAIKIVEKITQKPFF